MGTLRVRVYAAALTDDPPVDTAVFAGPTQTLDAQAWCDLQVARGLCVFEIDQLPNEGE